MAYIEFKNVEKIYKIGEVDIKALDKANFEIEKQEKIYYEEFKKLICKE